MSSSPEIAQAPNVTTWDSSRAVPLGGAAACTWWKRTPQPEHARARRQPACRRRHGAAASRTGARVPWDTRNTNLAFWGNTAIQGRYDGLRVIYIRAPGNPRELALFTCVSPQGDVGVYGNLLFRSVDSPQVTDRCTAVSQSGEPDRRRLRAGVAVAATGSKRDGGKDRRNTRVAVKRPTYGTRSEGAPPRGAMRLAAEIRQDRRGSRRCLSLRC